VPAPHPGAAYYAPAWGPALAAAGHILRTGAAPPPSPDPEAPADHEAAVSPLRLTTGQEGTILGGMEQGLVYVEYISRLPGVPLAEFQRVLIQAQQSWATGHGEDRLLLSAGRTWRLGPEPEYLHVWHSPRHGLQRLDDWDAIFHAGEAERHAQTVGRVSRIDRAGCYRALLPPLAAGGGPYYAELFRPTGSGEAIRALYQERARGHPALRLHLLATRLGRLAPDPGGLAVWALPDFGALSTIVEELDGVREPVRLVGAATYAETGREIL
jgi:hypothetical protein